MRAGQHDDRHAVSLPPQPARSSRGRRHRAGRCRGSPHRNARLRRPSTLSAASMFGAVVTANSRRFVEMLGKHVAQGLIVLDDQDRSPVRQMLTPPRCVFTFANQRSVISWRNWVTPGSLCREFPRYARAGIKTSRSVGHGAGDLESRRARSSSPRRRARSAARPRRSSAAAPAARRSAIGRRPPSARPTTAAPLTSTQVCPLCRAGHRQHVVQAHRQVGQDDLQSSPGGASCVPPSPTPRGRARARSSRNIFQHTQSSSRPPASSRPMIASNCSAMAPSAMRITVAPRDAQQDGRALLPARQAGHRQADHDGVVAGQRDVDQDHLRAGRPGPGSARSRPCGNGPCQSPARAV